MPRERCQSGSVYRNLQITMSGQLQHSRNWSCEPSNNGRIPTSPTPTQELAMGVDDLGDFNLDSHDLDFSTCCRAGRWTIFVSSGFC